MRSILRFWLLSLCVLSSAQSKPEWMLFEEKERTLGNFEVTLTLKVPITPLRLIVEPKELKNCTATPSLPLEMEVTNSGPTRLFTYGASDRSKEWKCNYTSKFFYGNASVKDLQNCTLLYPLPNQIEPKVIQGFNTNDTHSGRFGYAVDFEVPVGSQVLAAHDGVVAEILDEDSPKVSEGNYIALLHQSGFLTKYTHLKAHSLRVKVGSRVLAGTPLAESGTSGFREDGKAMTPHLHFDAYVAKEERTTIPFTLKKNGTCLRF